MVRGPEGSGIFGGVQDRTVTSPNSAGWTGSKREGEGQRSRGVDPRQTDPHPYPSGPLTLWTRPRGSGYERAQRVQPCLTPKPRVRGVPSPKCVQCAWSMVSSAVCIGGNTVQFGCSRFKRAKARTATPSTRTTKARSGETKETLYSWPPRRTTTRSTSCWTLSATTSAPTSSTY